ncbi:hypothetical protein A3A40_03310 [Candidatus Kaiserbacteria bacterium RIFCSPLOWO2_01_FULL_54_20]|uniref:Phosphatidic acid phosphatase type 2/haloperoxidase domain-containing protein n=1 Tax=Candidatus Kaiserbacteria bacterium RIFCSPLOWO2_01_FULL_54_20 TaxID=1798513 RepID=A0A1F6EJ38_9BACT|nr:MAG: hypothetical protein A3A40_03310 [Candidatus Kaiserbacteria bacterium RIFCSPLOWO2_01_FULL_54_20]
MSGLDAYILELLYSSRSDGLAQVFTFITQFGSTVVIGSLALALGIFFIVRKRLSYFAGLCVSVMGTIAVVFPLKELIARARPDAMYRVYIESGFSLPSGHAAFSLALYGFMAYIAWKNLPRWRVHILTVLGTLVVLVGFSRLYLGLHFASDVLSGYLIAGIFLLLGILVAERLNRHSLWF